MRNWEKKTLVDNKKDLFVFAFQHGKCINEIKSIGHIISFRFDTVHTEEYKHTHTHKQKGYLHSLSFHIIKEEQVYKIETIDS